MTRYIGRLINVGFGIEAVRGTKVVAQSWQPKTDFKFEEKTETIQNESSIGVIDMNRGSDVVKRYAEGDIAGIIETNSVGYLLLSLLGSVTSAAHSGAGGAYDHDFTLAQTNSTQSLTIGIEDPGIADTAYSLAMIESLTLSANNGEYATFTVTFKAKPGEAQSHTVSYAVDNRLLARHTTFKTATNLAGLGAATGVCIDTFEIKFTKNLEDIYCIGSESPIDFVNTAFQVEGSITAVFNSEEFRDYQLDGDKRALRIQMKDTNVTIGTSANPELTIDLPLAAFTEFSRDMSNDKVVMQTLTFTGLYSLADSSSVNILLTNTKASYVSA